MTYRGIVKIILLFMCIVAMNAPARAAEEVFLYEQKIKAGLVYNFLKFTSWPGDALSKNGNRLNICLFGGDSFDGYLYPLEGKTAQQFIITITAIDKTEQAKNCSMVFVHQNKQSELAEFFRFVAGQPILTISDISGFSRQGGMVEMSRDNESIALLINEKEAHASGLQIQNRILKLAKAVATKKG